MAERITSPQNPRIKNVLRLSKARERRGQDLIVIEGYREIMMAAESGVVIRELYIAPEVCADAEKRMIADALGRCALFEISRPVFERIAYRDNSDGLIALAEPKPLSLDGLELGDNPLVLVLESPEKPGNIGAILRTADAAALDAVIVCDPKTDLFNPNVIRASLGCIFSCQVAACSSGEALAFLRTRGFRIHAAALTATQYYYDSDFRGPSAITMGSEAYGLTPLWLEQADRQIRIPMGGKVDSLNLSTSAAVLVFEAKRQRACDQPDA